jgi:hypothetical protein
MESGEGVGVRKIVEVGRIYVGVNGGVGVSVCVGGGTVEEGLAVGDKEITGAQPDEKENRMQQSRNDKPIFFMLMVSTWKQSNNEECEKGWESLMGFLLK